MGLMVRQQINFPHLSSRLVLGEHIWNQSDIHFSNIIKNCTSK